jgi:acetyl esterase/lipase
MASSPQRPVTAVVINHRLHGPTDYVTAQTDVAAAIAYAHEHAAALGIDGERVAVWAFSGGGPLLSQYMRSCPPQIRCLLAFYAMLDLRALITTDADLARVELLVRLSPPLTWRSQRYRSLWRLPAETRWSRLRSMSSWPKRSQRTPPSS